MTEKKQYECWHLASRGQGSSVGLMSKKLNTIRAVMALMCLNREVHLREFQSKNFDSQHSQYGLALVRLLNLIQKCVSCIL